MQLGFCWVVNGGCKSDVVQSIIGYRLRFENMNFFENLDLLLDDIDNQKIVDEWYLCDFIDNHIKTLSAQQAFDTLKSYVPYLVNRQGFDYEMLNVLFALKNQANTNEKFYTEEQKNIILNNYRQDVEIDKIRDIFY